MLRFEALEQVVGGIFDDLLLRFGQLVFFEEVEEFQFFFFQPEADVALVFLPQVFGKLYEVGVVVLGEAAAGVVAVEDTLEALQEGGAGGVLGQPLLQFVGDL